MGAALVKLLRRSLAALLLLLATPGVSAEPTAFIAIIIDDVGNNLDRGMRAIDLPAPVTISILPFSRYADPLAQQATRVRKEIMVHMPMANVSEKPLGPGGLTPFLPKQDFLRVLRAALDQLPEASGVNNHMGSYLTQQRLEMTWLMDEVRRRNLFFVDSRTTSQTVAARVASQKAVFSSSRDVFLDNELSFFEIDREFQRLVSMAKLRGTAIAIGHPHRETLEYLEMALPNLRHQNVEVIPASNLIAIQQMTDLRLARSAAD